MWRIVVVALIVLYGLDSAEAGISEMFKAQEQRFASVFESHQQRFAAYFPSHDRNNGRSSHGSRQSAFAVQHSSFARRR